MSSSSSISSDDERENSAQLALPSPPGSRPSSRASSRCSSPQSPRKRRNGGLPSAGGIGATLQNTVEELIQRDVLDTGVVVELANSKEAQQKLEDLLPIHFYSWRLKNVEAALVYTLLHMFVLLQQYNEMVRERSVYEDYISHLKAQLEEDQQPEVGSQQHEREEVVRLRRENAELRQEKAKLQASHSELYQINDAWSRDYNSLTKKIEALTSGSWSTSSNGTSTHHLTNGTPVTHAPATTAEQHQNARTPTHPPSFALSHASHSHACPNCFSLQEQLDQLSRQAKELGRKNRDLEKLLEEEERKSKQKDMLIKSLDSENQAVQLQIQEIGDLQAAARLKEDFRKLELKMRQLDKQHQDTTSKKIQLQQQVDKLRHAFMSILGVSSSSRRHHHDCRVQQYMSEPLPPPPTPPGLIARGDHMGSLVEKDRQLRVLFDEQVTGFERATQHNMSLPSDTRSWPQITKRSPRPNTLVPMANGHTHHLPSKTGAAAQPGAVHQLPCPTCRTPYDIGSESGFAHMFEHISYCGPKIVKTELLSSQVT